MDQELNQSIENMYEGRKYYFSAIYEPNNYTRVLNLKQHLQL